VSYLVGDFLDELDHELGVARDVAARAVDRADALNEFRSRAIAVATVLHRSISAQDVFDAAKNERERAELRALADRITQDAGGDPAISDATRPGAPLRESDEL
jgi:hypothetical protein